MAKYRVIKYTRKIKKKSGNELLRYNMVIDLNRFGKQLGEAQKKLDESVFTSMKKYMPMQHGTFIEVTQAMNDAYVGTGKVVAAAPPYGRFLYEGKTMVDEKTGSPWARKGARKVKVSQYTAKSIEAKENLVFSRKAHPKATSHWFGAAKKSNLAKWVKIAKKTAGGG